MDCKTARLLLDYRRPRVAELDAAETGALEEHLSSCESCDQLAGAERRADEAVGKAMRQVDVPDQLRTRILSRLNDERGEKRRRWVARYLRAAIAAAAVLLLGLGLWRWFSAPPVFRAQDYLSRANSTVFAPPTAEDVKARFAGQGVQTAPPTDLNYNYLRWMFLANVEGRPTPMLIFHDAAGDDRHPGRPQHALVFLLSDRQFDLNALPDKPPSGTDNYEYKCDIHHVHGEPFGYVIYYTGNDHGWLDRPPDAPPPVAEGN
jgi:hypothetical protein